ncbi:MULTISPECIES: nucleotide exchange factor GrpE [unclassified Mucilaginibacter]|uniref:nucleotide exchange factor GrpE n=1 Tax=unclassified Mucilaginibacter TaxID=2617802 RepID=UPI002AC8BC0F|nr:MULTISPECIES: nucleotide exchange factor GrpE [unclassified Mucilaginibacter]MEB0263331.1 nucleotide exchange factor GrpE [Mucilaginibacter sp. 10I4]MEB0280723.1 nucleotide exchange factor GrpE [Mucilaginibacter sp. 10B2]MEB0301440.1 nucleotide exchange factor GrpE [Mucilaginibacter sp. 5C4]WPX22687.1 nucleotide exchange factor GrpE [Mucilaginibacter sp. 5C4]
MNFNDMLKKKNKGNSETPENTAEVTNENGQADGQEQTTETTEAENGLSAEEKHKEELTQANDKYLRLYAEFDNFRRRTIKEREDARKTEGKDIIIALLPVLDDFERALRAMDTVTDVVPVKEGVALIQHKLKNILTQKGLKEMQSIGTTFDPDLHEAITNIPAPTDDMKGKVVDEMEKGYELNEKVIRFAKVIVGA